MNKNDRIEHLVERFLDGRTTNAEEQELYAWFRSSGVPEGWEYLRDMFAWYEAGMPDAAQPKTQLTRSMSLRRVVRWVASVAAVVVVALSVWFSVGASSRQKALYDDSYIVENGIRYDNIDDIGGDIEAMMHRAEEIESMANELLAWADM